MQKIIKVDNKVVVFLENGACIESIISDEDFEKVLKSTSDEEILAIVNPQYKQELDKKQEVLSFIEKIRKSKILRITDNVVYWDNVSNLSLPQDLAESIVDAELNKDELKLTAYQNFWTLMSLNIDKDCRNNLYWFLHLHGLKIAKCGFFVAYRNVDSTNEEGVYTDHHTHSTRIKIGEMVTLDRSKCNCDSNVECSSGLHCASVNWLKKNYFGNTGLAVLVNPADVVAVPKRSEYGKLRTCAYLPMAIINYDKNDNVIPINVEDGFDCSYVTKVIYEGTMGTEEDSIYKIQIPKIKGLVNESIQDKLLEIAKDCIVNKQL